MLPDLYQTLGVRKNATPRALKAAYRKRAFQTHPDRNGGDDTEFKDVQRAWEVLSDPARRQRYDATGDTSPVRNGQALAVAGLVTTILRNLFTSLAQAGRKFATVDLVGSLKAGINDQLRQTRQNLQAIEATRTSLLSLRGRFSEDAGGKLLAEILEGEIGSVERLAAQATEQEATCRAALETLAGSRFRWEQARTDGWGTGTSATTARITWGVE